MSEHVIEIGGLSRSFGKKQVLSGVNLSIPRGVVFGLVGENGAGKTTIIRHILGTLKAQAGRVRVFGLDPVQDPVSVLGRIGYLSEDRDLPAWMRIGQLINHSACFYPDWDDALAGELLDRFDLDRDQKVSTLSRGQKARAGLLVALAHKPDVLLLDEPSSGLDAVVRRDILGAIIRTVADEGRTVLFSSHLLDEVQRVADQVAMIHEGKVLLCDELNSLINAHHRLTLRFPTSLAGEPAIEGVLSWSGSRNEWTCLCNGGIDQVRQQAAEAGAEIVDDCSPSLEDIFISQIGR